MKLRFVTTVDFRKNEWTHFQEMVKAQPALSALSHGDVAVFRNHGGDQILFVYGTLEVEGKGPTRTVIRSERLRLTNGGRWDDLMVADYAERVGIRLIGLKTLSDHLKALRLAVEESVRKEAA